MKRRKKQLNRRGFTLVEVMVAITILLLAAEIVSISVTFNAKMSTRAQGIYHANEELGQMMQDETAGVKAELSMNVGAGTISKAGKLYSQGSGSDTGGMEVHAMQAGDDVLGDLFGDSEKGVDEGWSADGKPEAHGLPEAFPQYDDLDQEKVPLVENYFVPDEEGGGAFMSGNLGKNAYAILSGLDISASGEYTASGVTTLVIESSVDITSLELNNRYINLWMGAETYCLDGGISVSYPKQANNQVPVHMYFMPESGHGQPALVYVAAGSSVSIVCDDDEAVEPITYEIPSGWYAIPAGSKTAGNANDLLKLRSRNGTGYSIDWENHPKDYWEYYRLAKDDWGKTGKSETPEEQEKRYASLEAELDKAYARLILAGLVEPNVTEENPDQP